MLEWLLKQRLSVKLFMPSVVGVVLLLASGAYVFALVAGQRTLQKEYDQASEQERQVENLVREYSQAQARIYKGVCLALAGMGSQKAGAAIQSVVDSRKAMESSLEAMIQDKRNGELHDSLSAAGAVSEKFFSYALQVQENIDDPATAAANMVTTERKYEALRSKLEFVGARQHENKARAAAGIQRHLSMLTTSVIASTSVVAFLTLAVAFFNLKFVMHFVQRIREDVRILASGDFSHRVNVTVGDELGELASSVEEMRLSFCGLIQGLKDTAGVLLESSNGSHDISNRLAEDVSIVDNRTHMISSSSREAKEQAQRMVSGAVSVSQSAREVASALEQMKTTASAISQNCVHEDSMAKETGRTAEDMLRGMEGLDSAASEIGGILKVINDIAAKTKLLALNATIEAARAGEAGKGFGVVASEVKELAVQSSLAATQIQERVLSVQTQASVSMKSVREIAQAIQQFSQISSVIAVAVSEQSSMVHQISGSVQNVSSSANLLVEGLQDVALRSSDVMEAIEIVGSATASASALASETANNALFLNQMAQNMEQSISGFTV
jgi:methyl-accepting chemotaxis protein